MSERRACPFTGCRNRAHGKSYCTGHMAQAARGDALAPLGAYVRRPRSPRPLLPNPERPGTMLVPLTRGYLAVIDAKDASVVGQYNWTAVTRRHTATVYASTAARREDDTRTTLTLHRLVWSIRKRPAADEIDHKNQDGLDCTGDNLRAATSAQNKHNIGKRRNNTSGYKGVFWEPRRRRWLAKIVVDGRPHCLGHYTSRTDASLAYATAARELVGDFARAQ